VAHKNNFTYNCLDGEFTFWWFRDFWIELVNYQYRAFAYKYEHV